MLLFLYLNILCLVKLNLGNTVIYLVFFHVSIKIHLLYLKSQNLNCSRSNLGEK